MAARLTVIAAVFACALIGLGAAVDVITLHDGNFEATQKGSWLLEFYAPWCGHCKSLAPKYEEAANKLMGSVALGKVDCTVEEELCGVFGVRGYPTLFFAKDGKMVSYDAERTVEALVKFSTTDGPEAVASKGTDLPAVTPPTAEELEVRERAAKVEANYNAGKRISVDLNDFNFFSKISSGGEWVVSFGDPHGGSMVKAIPGMEMLAQDNQQMKFAMMNPGESPFTFKMFGSPGLEPAVFRIKDGKWVSMNSSNKKDNRFFAIKQFVESSFGAAAADSKHRTGNLPAPHATTDLYWALTVKLWHHYFRDVERFLDKHLIPSLFGFLGVGVVIGFALGVMSVRYCGPRPAGTTEDKKKR